MSLKNFFVRLWGKIENLWHRLSDEVKEIAPIVIEVLENVKKYRQSPVGDVLDFIIPKGIVKTVYDKLMDAVPKVLIGYSTIADLDKYPDLNAKLRAVLAGFDHVEPQFLKAHWHGIATLILELTQDGDLSYSDIITITEYVKKFLPAAKGAATNESQTMPDAGH